MLVPFRLAAFEFVASLVSLLPSGLQVPLLSWPVQVPFLPIWFQCHVAGKRKFAEQYGPDEEQVIGSKKPRLFLCCYEGPSMLNILLVSYQLLFTGNCDDCFCFGIRYTQRSLTLMSPLYESDIIVASSLGLRLEIEGKE